MTSIDTIYLFIFVFSLVAIFRSVFRFIISLLQENPEKLVFSSRETIFMGLFITYIITYLIQTN
jgi:hypothetical protein